MCRFPQVKHFCGHTTLINHGRSIELCDEALILVRPDLDRVPAFCTPLKDDLDNEDVILDLSEDYSWCPDCHAKQPTPACGDQSDQSWEAECLKAFNADLTQMLKGVEDVCQIIEYDCKMPAIVKAIQHPWLREMLQLNSDGFCPLGDAIIDHVHNVQRGIDKVLAKCNAGIPMHSLHIDFYATMRRYDEAWFLMDHFIQITKLLKHLPKRKDYHNEVCKEAEMCKLRLQGPQEAPQDLLYLQPGFKTPTTFGSKRDSHMQIDQCFQKLALDKKAARKDYYALALSKLLRQSDVLPFRRRAFHKRPSKYVSKKCSPPPPVKVSALSGEDRAEFGKLEVHYFRHASQKLADRCVVS
ncbi:hypothetical protein SLS60_004569 [Paraconiothyrium brasiliense]|uniref:Uncharacterized protein n=1 Tax=Paraconiothyrium brasiliense TaxID=300254 RepID=A0ABR3RKS5_9PLEO